MGTDVWRQKIAAIGPALHEQPKSASKHAEWKCCRKRRRGTGLQTRFANRERYRTIIAAPRAGARGRVLIPPRLLASRTPEPPDAMHETGVSTLVACIMYHNGRGMYDGQLASCAPGM